MFLRYNFHLLSLSRLKVQLIYLFISAFIRGWAENGFAEGPIESASQYQYSNSEPIQQPLIPKCFIITTGLQFINLSEHSEYSKINFNLTWK